MRTSGRVQMLRLLSWIPIAVMSIALGILAVYAAFAATSEHEGVRTFEYGGVIAAIAFAIFALAVWPSVGDRLPTRLQLGARVLPGVFFIVLAALAATFSLRPPDPNDGRKNSLLLVVPIVVIVFVAVYLIAVRARSSLGHARIPADSTQDSKGLGSAL